MRRSRVTWSGALRRAVSLCKPFHIGHIGGVSSPAGTRYTAAPAQTFTYAGILLVTTPRLAQDEETPMAAPSGLARKSIGTGSLFFFCVGASAPMTVLAGST